MSDPSPSDPALVTVSAATYRLLLAFYPASFRREYGRPMAQLFRDCCLKSYRQSGPAGVYRLWARTLRDWFKSVLEEQTNRGITMSRMNFIRLGGWGLMLAAISLLLTLANFDEAAVEAGLNQIFGGPASPSQHDLFQTVTGGVGWLDFFAANLLIVLGLLGLRARYGRPAGHWARLALGAGAAGGAAALLSIGWMVVSGANGRWLMNAAMAVMFGGLFAFGLVALRRKPMLRGNWLPLLVGFWWPAIAIRANLYFLVTGGWGPGVPGWLSFAIFFAMSLGLALLGYVLQADLPQEEVAPVRV
jgi:hypothetical protein